MTDLLQSDDYIKIRKDPTAIIEKRIKEHLTGLEKKGSLPTPLIKKLTPKNSKPPQIYGLPKIHKDNVPLRPIVCTIGSPTYKLAKHLSLILSPLIGKTDSHIKNSTHFVEKLYTIWTNETDQMISFDVKSLFTMVPIVDSMTIIKDRLLADEDLEDRTTLSAEEICRLTELCLKSTYFKHGEQFFEQKDGMAMGSPLSPFVANIFMEDFEQTALSTSNLKPKIWFRYVDDTFVIWQHGKDKLEEFLEHLNGLHERIQFTMELEQDNTIPFLDVLVERRSCQFSTKVYRKPTHNDSYLHYRSNHHPRVKSGIVKCLGTRAQRICDRKDIDEETTRLKNVFQAIGYPTYKIQSLLTIRHRTIHRRDPGEDDRKTLVLPYIPGLSENISSSCRGLPVRVSFSSRFTLRFSLTKLKVPIPPWNKTGVIYSVPCCCGRPYIGETGCSLKTRLSEHKRAVRIGDSQNAISVHVNSNTGHYIAV